MTIIYTTTAPEQLKFAVIVPKKNVKTAVKRNRIKRIIREAVHSMIKGNTIKSSNLHMIIRVKMDISRMKSYEVKKILEKILEKIQKT